MYREITEQKIAESLKSGNSVEHAVWKAIKNEFLMYEKAAAGNVVTDEVELRLIKKLADQHRESIDQFKAAGRDDLYPKEEAELAVLEPLLPKEPTDEELEVAIKEIVDGLAAPSMKDMKTVQSKVKETYPTVNGGKVAQMFKKAIGM